MTTGRKAKSCRAESLILLVLMIFLVGTDHANVTLNGKPIKMRLVQKLLSRRYVSADTKHLVQPTSGALQYNNPSESCISFTSEKPNPHDIKSPPSRRITSVLIGTLRVIVSSTYSTRSTEEPYINNTSGTTETAISNPPQSETHLATGFRLPASRTPTGTVVSTYITTYTTVRSPSPTTNLSSFAQTMSTIQCTTTTQTPGINSGRAAPTATLSGRPPLLPHRFEDPDVEYPSRVGARNEDLPPMESNDEDDTDEDELALDSPYTTSEPYEQAYVDEEYVSEDDFAPTHEGEIQYGSSQTNMNLPRLANESSMESLRFANNGPQLPHLYPLATNGVDPGHELTENWIEIPYPAEEEFGLGIWAPEDQQYSMVMNAEKRINHRNDLNATIDSLMATIDRIEW